jgi:uncharacterized protein (TIGR02270 family)
VVAEHAEEAAFLWLLRDQATAAPHYTLADLTRLDGRVEAHLDGLRVAGPAGHAKCAEGLGLGGPGEVFAAAILALEGRDAARHAPVLDLAAAERETGRGFISALAWLPPAQAVPAARELLRAEDPSVRRLGLAGLAAHRADPGPALRPALTDLNPALRARALEAAGELGRTDLLPVVAKAMGDDDDACRFAAAWAAARLGGRSGTISTVLRTLADASGPFAGRAWDLLLRCQEPSEAVPLVRRLLTRPAQRRLGVVGVGVVGDPALVDDLLSLMADKKLARVAGEAFCMLTGVDLALRDLDVPPPEEVEGGPSERPEDEEVTLDPDENLPWPATDRVAAWWGRNRGEFRPGTRYLCGRELTPEALRGVLRRGFQRQRATAALELALRETAQPLFEVRAPGHVQTGKVRSWSS